MERPIPRLAALAVALGGAASAQLDVTSQLVASGFTVPVAVAQPAGEATKLFVAERAGLVRVVEHGVVQPAPFLDLTDQVEESDHKGLLNLLFHPDYPTNGLFYVYFTSFVAPDVTHFLVRYRVPDPGSYVVDLGSATTLVGLYDPGTGLKFNGGGGMDFGPDGKLYLALGDLRFVVPAWGCAAQDGGVLPGKVLRLNDDGSIPADNPFVGDPAVRDELWAFGLRAPYRLTIDPVGGDVYVADVGEATYEEVNHAPADGGGANFGWRVLEGSLCNDLPACSAYSCSDPGFTAPLVQYGHQPLGGDYGCCVIGGYVYRGAEIPALSGTYLYGDLCTAQTRGFSHQGGVMGPVQDLTAALAPFGPEQIDGITSYGVDSDGELYVVDGAPWAGPGEVFRIVPRRLTPDVPALSVSAGGAQTLTLTAGAAHASSVYLLLGSTGGSLPGVPLEDETLPLAVPDPYFDFTLANVNTAPLSGSFGALDAAGAATAAVTVPPGTGPSFVGLRLTHAYVVFDLPAGSGAVVAVSNSASVLLAP